MLSEDKVLQEYEYFNTSQSSLKHVKHVIGGDKKHDNEDEDRSSIDKLEINNQSINTSSSSDDDDDDDDDVNEREENERLLFIFVLNLSQCPSQRRTIK